MFTGIISDIGQVLDVASGGDTRVRIGTGYDAEGIALGASIACDGCCLTVIDRGMDDGQNWFDVSFSAETRARTNLSTWAPGKRINLERSLRVGDELGGHLVSGHVDGVADVRSATQSGDSTELRIAAPELLARFIAPKGSVALNGTSLTVNEVDGVEFTINLIPHTKAVTTWGDVGAGDAINLEIDTLARYVARLAEFSAP